jgi:hypothetical protein
LDRNRLRRATLVRGSRVSRAAKCPWRAVQARDAGHLRQGGIARRRGGWARHERPRAWSSSFREAWSSSFRERKVRRFGPPVPPEISVRRPRQAGAPVRCSCCPPTVFPPCESVPLRRTRTRWPPSKRPSPCGCCTDAAYSAEPLWQPGPHRVAVRLPWPRRRQAALRQPFFPPGGQSVRASPPAPHDRPSVGTTS